jgi:CheY-like chemotaxis protein
VALQRATEDIELILKDIQMPVMDGLAATAELLDRYLVHETPKAA